MLIRSKKTVTQPHGYLQINELKKNDFFLLKFLNTLTKRTEIWCEGSLIVPEY